MYRFQIKRVCRIVSICCVQLKWLEYLHVFSRCHAQVVTLYRSRYFPSKSMVCKPGHESHRSDYCRFYSYVQHLTIYNFTFRRKSCLPCLLLIKYQSCIDQSSTRKHILNKPLYCHIIKGASNCCFFVWLLLFLFNDFTQPTTFAMAVKFTEISKDSKQ